MRTRPGRKLYLLFAAWTLLAVVAAGALVITVRFQQIRVQAEEDAAVAASSSLTPALEAETGDLSNPALVSFADAARGLLGEQVSTIRLWDNDGRLLASTDGGEDGADASALSGALAGDTASFKASGPQGDVLVSYSPIEPGAVLEVRQDYDPIAQSVSRSRLSILLLTAAGGAAVFIVLQPVFWSATRGLRAEYDRLRYLYRTGQAVSSSLELTDVLEQLARDTAIFSRASVGFVTLLEEGTNDLILRASFEREADIAAHHHRRVEEWFLRRCAATGETIAGREQRLYRSLLGYEPERAHPTALLCVAIRGREQVIGTLTVVREEELGQFKPTEIEMVEEMAARAAMAVEQSMLFTKMRRYASEVELSFDSTLKLLTAAFDSRDAGTQGHAERVSRLTLAVAREMNVPKERLAHIERGALLHDIGKTGVPEEVLRKPGALNDGEWETIEKHPLLAGLMVSKVEFLEGALPILLYHHEHFDGAGYPFGLQGDTIPLEARIFAVVDAFDAMTSERPYREAMSAELALQEIQRQAESQFDPRVVEAFARVLARERSARKRAA